MKATKTIAGAVALAVLASTAFSIGAAAADASVTLNAANVTAEAGGEFSVDISLTGVPATKVQIMDFAVDIDNTYLTVTEASIGKAADTGAANADGTNSSAPVFEASIHGREVDVLWTTGANSDTWIGSDGVVLTLKGTVAAGAENGTVVPVKLIPVSRETYDGSGTANTDICIGVLNGKNAQAYDVTIKDGSVTIGSKTTTTEPKETTTTATQPQKETTTAAVTTTRDAGTTTAKEAGTTTAKAVQPILDNVLLGDVNVDGEVDITDAVLLNKKLAGAVELNAQQTANADTTNDNELTTRDAIVLLRFIVGSVKELPAE